MPILGILGHVIVDWNTKKHKKTVIFGLKSYYIAYHSKTTWRAKLKFGHSVGAYKCFMKTKFGGAGHMTKILQAKSEQKVDNFEPIYLGNYQYWWKMVCDFWAHYQLSFFWLCSFTPTWIFFFFCFSFFLLFFFLLFFSDYLRFKPLNGLYSKFEWLKISG